MREDREQKSVPAAARAKFVVRGTFLLFGITEIGFASDVFRMASAHALLVNLVKASLFQIALIVAFRCFLSLIRRESVSNSEESRHNSYLMQVSLLTTSLLLLLALFTEIAAPVGR